MVEWVKYTAYGIPCGMPKGDVDSDGDLDAGDVGTIQTWPGGYDVRADLNLDGVVNGTDATLANAASPITLGFGALSDVGNRKGYAGYEHAPELANSMWHVRNRVMISELLGRWITRDPIGYAGGSNLYQYVRSNPLQFADPFGLAPGDGGPQGGGGRRPVGEPIYPPGYGLALCAGGGRRTVSDPIEPPGSDQGQVVALPYAGSNAYAIACVKCKVQDQNPQQEQEDDPPKEFKECTPRAPSDECSEKNIGELRDMTCDQNCPDGGTRRCYMTYVCKLVEVKLGDKVYDSYYQWRINLPFNRECSECKQDIPIKDAPNLFYQRLRINLGDEAFENLMISIFGGIRC